MRQAHVADDIGGINGADGKGSGPWFALRRASPGHKTGEILWADAASVKIEWEDGEQVAWRRDSPAGRPVEIIDANEGQAAAPTAPAAPQPAAPETPPTAA